MTDYVSVWAKLRRAEEHLEAVERELRIWIQSKPVSLVPAGPPKANAYGTSHNFRSALGHLAMALAVDNGADPYDSTILFPICGHPGRFYGQPVRGIRRAVPPRGTGGYAIRALRPAAQAFIEGLQPYSGKHGTTGLTELQHLGNRDKHRFIIEPRLEILATFQPPPGVIYRYASSLTLKDGAYFAAASCQSGYSGVKVQPPISAGICVERSSRVGFMEIQPFVRRDILPFTHPRSPARPGGRRN
jgi:hypothetical protein